jgi:hypothetical protein
MLKNILLLFSLWMGFLVPNNLYSQEVPADSLFNAYKQDSANNCAAIALIKANLNAFGFDLFIERRIDDSTREFLLKDSTKILLTDSDIQLAKRKFNADTSSATTPYLKKIVEQSILCYAIMAKKFPYEFPQLATSSYEDNLAFISDISFDVRFGINLLGTGEYFIFLKRWANIRGKKGVVVWSPHHTVFASERRCDMQGSASNFYRGTWSYIKFWGRMYIDTPALASRP